VLHSVAEASAGSGKTEVAVFILVAFPSSFPLSPFLCLFTFLPFVSLLCVSLGSSNSNPARGSGAHHELLQCIWVDPRLQTVFGEFWVESHVPRDSSIAEELR